MSELLPLLDAGFDAFSARVHQVKDDQWSSASCCSDWTIADLVMHVVDETRWAPPLLEGHDLGTAGSIVEGTADRGDPARNWDAAVVESRRAFYQPGALERTVNLSRGPTPAAQYASEMIFDLAVHSWDLGTAVGDRIPLPAALVDFAWALAQEFGDLAVTGLFGPPVEVAEDASAEDKLVALTGRHPR